MTLWMRKNNTTFYFSKEKYHISGLFKNVQMQGARSQRSETYFLYTSQRRGLKHNAADYSTLQGMSSFQQPFCSCFFIMINTAEIAPSVMPIMRSIWPNVCGAILISFAFSSLDRPGTVL
jgi:hypothetical protein